MNARLVCVVATIFFALPCPRSALATVVFSDDFEGGTIGANPTTPVIGQPWFNNGVAVATANTVQENPLLEGINTSAQVLKVFRGPGIGGGYAWIDLPIGQQSVLSAGGRLTIDFKYLQVSQSNGGEVAVYDSATHDFSNNAVDLNWFGPGLGYWYDGTVPQFKPIGPSGNASGASTWDQCELIVDFTAKHWTLQLNGGEINTLPFTNNDNLSKVQSLFFAPASQNVLAFFDDIQVDISPAPAGNSGDYNLNGVVDAADYVVWRHTEGQTATPAGSGADGDGNGTVGPEDFTYWRARFGNSAGSGLGAGTVPEPSSMAIALIAGATIYLRLRPIRNVEAWS